MASSWSGQNEDICPSIKKSMTSPTMYYTSVYCFALLLKCIAANSLIKKNAKKDLAFYHAIYGRKELREDASF